MFTSTFPKTNHDRKRERSSTERPARIFLHFPTFSRNTGKESFEATSISVLFTFNWANVRRGRKNGIDKCYEEKRPLLENGSSVTFARMLLTILTVILFCYVRHRFKLFRDALCIMRASRPMRELKINKNVFWISHVERSRICIDKIFIIF